MFIYLCIYGLTYICFTYVVLYYIFKLILSISYCSLSISIYRSIYLTLLSYIYIIYLSIYLPIYLSVYLSICLSIYPSIHLSIFIYHYLYYLFINTYHHLSVSIYIYLLSPIFLSILYPKFILSSTKWLGYFSLNWYWPCYLPFFDNPQLSVAKVLWLSFLLPTISQVLLAHSLCWMQHEEIAKVTWLPTGAWMPTRRHLFLFSPSA